MFERVSETGEATWSDDQLLPMHRFGYTEECYFDYTFSPIRGQGAQVEGVFNVVTETTYRFLNDRRNRFLRELGTQDRRGQERRRSLPAWPPRHRGRSL